jgi:uncharacterized protein with PCYCGC motif
MNFATRGVLIAAISAFGILGFGSSLARAQSNSTAPDSQGATAQPAPAAPSVTKIDLPAFHPSAPKGPLPATLDPNQFPEVENQNIYALAAKEKAILYQQPCFCHCDREVNHKSLLDCYVDTHASVCMLCKKEAVLAYTESQQGKTAAQIRQDIIDGKWKAVDLTKYDDTVLPGR